VAIKGEKVGAFALERRLGVGTAGEVWKARLGERAVAVKLYAAPEAAEVFRAGGVPATPESVNLCVVRGGDAAAGLPWVASDYVEGPTLREVMTAEKYVPISASIPALIQMLRGLAALHKEKLAHGDLRPENIHMDEKGALRLGDVTPEGAVKERLARLFDKKHARPVPAARASKLTPYTAPELRKAGAWLAPLDLARADMYAFGVIAYEALTGTLPAPGLDLRTPSQRDKRVPKIMDELILRCVETTVRMRAPNAHGLEPLLLEGLEKAHFSVFASGDPSTWVRGTPWRRPGVHAGEETSRFTSDFKRLAQEKQ